MEIQSPKSNTRGFTIIEVLIVLAIAALILLIVFLAVPALERNSRNTAAKNEAARIIAATEEFMDDNGGRVPTCASFPCDSSMAPNDPATILNLSNAKYITDLQFYYPPGTTNSLSASSTQANMETGVVCGPYAGGPYITPIAAGYKSFMLVFGVEASNGTAWVDCLSS